MKKYDLIVVGGGLSGVGAAVAGARQGLSVMLIEKSNSLADALSGSLVFPFCP
jgi:glycerol-3-phosphate dehydrogenase